MTASAGAEDKIDFMNLTILGAACVTIFDEHNHECERKSIIQSSSANLPIAIN
jgi:hypothetical protein